ncbi:V-type ATP synthase subunit F [Porcipelethomonas sp.]|uniref:V-type ATP synthase subunit F n=1 Tax=Porcipelethomonas sp. TaxID=2981675 RepID=UPI003EF4E85A
MKFYLISDNIDTQMGMRLAGINGVVVHEPDEVKNELEKAVNDKDVAIILMTEKLVKLCEDLVYDIKLNYKSPLIVEIPDRHATSQITETINRYVSDAIGLKL